VAYVVLAEEVTVSVVDFEVWQQWSP